MCGVGVHSWGQDLLPLMSGLLESALMSPGSASSCKDLQLTIQGISSRCLQRHGFVLIVFYTSGESVGKGGQVAYLRQL